MTLSNSGHVFVGPHTHFALIHIFTLPHMKTAAANKISHTIDPLCRIKLGYELAC